MYKARPAARPQTTPKQGVLATLDLVATLDQRLGLHAHAGVSAGPVVERDRDLFGTTVNLASRIAGYAQPGEVLVNEAVVEAATNDALRFESAGETSLKGIPEPVPLFRAVSPGGDAEVGPRP